MMGCSRRGESIRRFRKEQFAEKAAEVCRAAFNGRSVTTPGQSVGAEGICGESAYVTARSSRAIRQFAGGYDKAETLANADEEMLRQMLRGDAVPVNVPPADTRCACSNAIAAISSTKLRNQIWRRLRPANPAAPPRAMALEDAKTIQPQHVFVRGNEGNPGEEVKPHFLSMSDVRAAQPFTHGSGRLEFAQAVASKDNPLTARVMVNRIWLHHFGAGHCPYAQRFWHAQRSADASGNARLSRLAFHGGRTGPSRLCIGESCCRRRINNLPKLPPMRRSRMH